MRRLVFVFIMAVVSLVSYGQTDKENNDSISQIKKLSVRPQNEQLNSYLQMDKPLSMDTAMHRLDFYTPMAKPAEEPIVLKLPPLDIYRGPWIDDLPLNPHYPYANDYAYAGIFGVSDRAWISTLSTNNFYPLAGRVRTVNAQLNYRVTDWLYVSGGPYASKYATYSAYRDDFGATGSMKFIVSDRIRFNAYGQYSINAKQNHIGGPLMDMYPHTYYGGTMEFKISDKFGIEAGMIRELNPFTGKWENKPIISPVFYK